MAQVTQADIIRLCTDFQSQNGIIALLSLLESWTDYKHIYEQTQINER